MNLYKNLKNYPEAIEVYNRAIKLNKNFFEAISNKSDVLHSQKKYTEALIELNKIYKEDPDFEGLLEKIISNKMFIFEWSELSKIKMSIKEKIIKDKIALDPLFIHYLFDEPKLHKLNSEKFISYEFKNVNRSNANKRKKVNKKIKIGYFSGDFHNHPVLHIMSNIFKKHDKSEFELYAFSWS